MILVDPRVHEGEIGIGEPGSVFKFGAPKWRDNKCSYCGSWSAAEAMRLLKTPGAKFSGTDKTFYKAYIEAPDGFGKFYFRHLRECTPEQLAEFNALSRKCFGLSWKLDDTGTLLGAAPRSNSVYGWQAFGVIGADGEPVFKEGSPRPPGPEFWT
jgi:hypothetical protein